MEKLKLKRINSTFIELLHDSSYTTQFILGRKDCNLYPAYIQATYPKWHERLSEYIHCKDCNHGKHYNNL